jgi:DNA polymerase/3'-5' exonuclease PolX
MNEADVTDPTVIAEKLAEGELSPARAALEIARKFVQFLKPHCQKLVVAGSLRRRKPFVSDIEILFVPKFERVLDPTDLFKERMIVTPATDRALDVLLELGVLDKRPNVDGVCAWGPKNKLGLHLGSGIAIDFFTATPENWFNYLVCRTGGADNNVRIAAAAKRIGWKWNPYDDGFSREHCGRVERHVVQSERGVFDFVGLEYLEPNER